MKIERTLLNRHVYFVVVLVTLTFNFNYVSCYCSCQNFVIKDNRMYNCPNCDGYVSIYNDCVICSKNPKQCLQPCDNLGPVPTMSPPALVPQFKPPVAPQCQFKNCDCPTASPPLSNCCATCFQKGELGQCQCESGQFSGIGFHPLGKYTEMIIWDTGPLGNNQQFTLDLGLASSRNTTHYLNQLYFTIKCLDCGGSDSVDVYLTYGNGTKNSLWKMSSVVNFKGGYGTVVLGYFPMPLPRTYDYKIVGYVKSHNTGWFFPGKRSYVMNFTVKSVGRLSYVWPEPTPLSPTTSPNGSHVPNSNDERESNSYTPPHVHSKKMPTWSYIVIGISIFVISIILTTTFYFCRNKKMMDQIGSDSECTLKQSLISSDQE